MSMKADILHMTDLTCSAVISRVHFKLSWRVLVARTPHEILVVKRDADVIPAGVAGVIA